MIGDIVLFKCTCLAEMKKDVAYQLRVAFNSVSSNLEYAICGCPAGHGPKCTCEHLACFCRHGNINYAESYNIIITAMASTTKKTVNSMYFK